MLTGLADEAAGVAAVEAGAQDYLVKGSVDGDQLARSIRYAIGRRQAEEAERELLLAEAQAREMTRLERGLAPKPLIENAAVWVASCYRAGRSRALLGGDFFDLVQSADEACTSLVGDVCGHGADEAAIGVSLRAAWRALALAGNRPESSCRRLQRGASSTSDTCRACSRRSAHWRSSRRGTRCRSSAPVIRGPS